MTTHELEIRPAAFAALLTGEKTMEFRQERGITVAVGDDLVLREWAPEALWLQKILPNPAVVTRGGVLPAGEERTGSFTGRQVTRRVTAICRGPQNGVAVGFVLMSLAAPVG
jgi:hypothetical protein